MILRDPVHGIVAFEGEEDAVVVRLLACREVQRLRRIRQLGLTSFAFIGAEHTRFAHAIGAAHVMQKLLEQLRRVDGDLPFWQRVTSERARDAIAAAFLHDLGHGPLSHLFEQALPWPEPGEGESGSGSHEWWTERILLDPDSDVHRVLAADDPHLPRRVADLIQGRHTLPYLAKAVSGTFDVDRCDYLLRDAHATGVRYGDYDLPWLLRSLRLTPPDAGWGRSPSGRDVGPASSAERRETGPVSRPDVGPGGSPSGRGEAGPGLAIDGTKGLSAIESFILARHFMFQQVYFHKSTRAAEWMIGAILRRAVSLLREGVRLAGCPSAFETVAAGDTPTVAQYIELDDQVLLAALHSWQSAHDPLLSDLCRRIRERSIFKAIELHDGDEQSWKLQLEKARAVARDAGLEPDVYVGLDIARDVPYADDESLTVVFPDGRVRRPAEVSFLLNRLRDETVTRVRIIFAPELFGAMRQALM